jgi:hypothetical protein
MRGRGLDLNHAADRVLNLVQIVRVPPGDQPIPLVQIAAGPGTSAMA